MQGCSGGTSGACQAPWRWWPARWRHGCHPPKQSVIAILPVPEVVRPLGQPLQSWLRVAVPVRGLAVMDPFPAAALSCVPLGQALAERAAGSK